MRVRAWHNQILWQTRPDFMSVVAAIKHHGQDVNTIWNNGIQIQVAGCYYILGGRESIEAALNQYRGKFLSQLQRDRLGGGLGRGGETFGKTYTIIAIAGSLYYDNLTRSEQAYTSLNLANYNDGSVDFVKIPPAMWNAEALRYAAGGGR